jgi:Domain of unknown function (DUF5916)/Carbohydrate family 9 binding domain-like
VRNKRYRFTAPRLVAACSLAAGLDAPAQDAVTVGQEKSVQVVRADVAPVIDGVLDDAAWMRAGVVDDFHEIEPTEYAPVSEPTVIYVLYDDSALYIGARMFDREPGEITARIMRQGEEVFADDWFSVIIDPFHDRRSGYRFITNPNGLRQEGLFQNVSETQWEWQGIWYAASSIDEEGWAAEIEIPFKSIAFDPANDTWGINFHRAIARRDERLGWVSRNRNSDPSISGTAVGFEGLEQGLGLDIVPSVSVSQQKDFELAVEHSDVDPSLDVFYKITPGLTGALTINTDFSATEVDDRQVNLTRFDLFFPEKRDFFLQDADIFEFGGLQENGRPFFSRSIGLSSTGEAVDLETGGKVSGRVGRFNIGALAIRQEEFQGIAADNAIVARVSANVLRESSVGFITTEGDPRSNLDNSLQGLDFVFRNTRLPRGRAFEANVWGQQSDTQDSDDEDSAYGFRVSAPNNTGMRAALRYAHLEENFTPGLGFVNRKGIDELDVGTEYTYRPARGLLRSVLFGINAERVETIATGELESQELDFQLLELEGRQGDLLELRRTRNREVLVEPFEISEGVVIIPGDYSFNETNLEISTGDQRKLWGNLDYTIGDFYDGDRVEVEASLSWRPSGRLRTQLSYDINDIHLPAGAFVTRLVRFRTDVVFSPRLSWVTLIQYDNVSEIIGINTRLHWVPEPGREGYLVLNRNVQDLDRDNRFDALSAEAAIKFNYTFRF